MSIDGQEQRTAFHDEMFSVEDEEVGPATVRTHYVIECVGSPLTTWLKVYVSESDATDITSFDEYWDEACTRLKIDGIELTALSFDQQDRLYTAVEAAQAAKRRHELREANIARAQAFMADLVIA